ncbi:MAG: outer membrane lipoprotein carrier protein LolA [Saprospiraceae bacterium]
MVNFIILIASFSFLTSFQNIDPNATKVLKKLEKAYSAKSLRIDFEYTYKPAESKASIQKGKFEFSENYYKLSLIDQMIYFDGESQWTYFKDRKEVQISNSSLEESSYHPLKFVNLYKSGKFKYRIESSDQNKVTIEFVPISKDEEYHKLKLTINQKNNSLNFVEVYQKNGDKFTIKFIKQEAINKLTKEECQLSSANLPGVHFEDLR